MIGRGNVLVGILSIVFLILGSLYSQSDVIYTQLFEDILKEKNKMPLPIPMEPQQIKRLNNYAGSDCGAKVLTTNEGSIGANNLLNTNRDSYYLSPCKNHVHFVIELCQAIQIKQFGVANYELFSNQFENVSLSCSVNGTQWIPLGNFTFVNQKILHLVTIPTPKWCRYVLFVENSWYGKEFYCSINQFVAYGVSSLDELVVTIVQPEEVKTVVATSLAENMTKFAESQILEIQRLNKEIVRLRNSFYDLEHLSNGKIQTTFYGLLILSIVLFLVLAYWLFMLSKQCYITELKAKQPSFQLLNPRPTFSPPLQQMAAHKKADAMSNTLGNILAGAIKSTSGSAPSSMSASLSSSPSRSPPLGKSLTPPPRTN
ncbi:hypothetical protein EIN_274150 [Entamoeba invadens IP1]|uniref:SUN domain-containing protein n=1 Tax=Entamoeba invadens IP1 TaxID=370355 RepID=A0A0A1U4N7_ENTIV|nr:hypothetical protein EIN_274150 [Entamoeba invadens IP1]ELP87848.1 hypothetical protein EIN_274150 [Entamoeba invadens IP1]|eukprot:XP_004254619.1 hypothetical protein EIN_274150 [Entamoeba invadens IP1]